MDFKQFFISCIKKHWKHFLPGIITLLIVDIVQLFIPLIIGDTINRLEILDIDFNGLLIRGFILMGVALIMSAMRFLWRYFIILSAFKIGFEMRRDIMKKLYSFPISFFSKNKTGDLMSIVVNDVDAVRFLLGMGMVAAFDMVILAIMALGMMIYYSPSLTLIAMIPAPLIVIILYYFEGPLHKRFLSIQELFGKISVKVKESIEGIALIKLYRLYGIKNDEFSELNKKYKRDSLVVTSIDALYNPIVNFFMMGILGALIYYGGGKVVESSMKLGDFIAFTRYLDIIVWPLMALGWVFSLYQRARSAYERIQGIMMQENNIISGDTKLNSIEKGISLKNVDFSYETGSFKLENINVEFKKSTLTGIAGKIGCGKTTFINLLLRLHDVNSGVIEINGVDIKNYNIKSLRDSIAYVPQEVFLFSDSILNNLRFADENISDEEIKKVLEVSDCNEFVKNLPNGINTVVGERGVSLSGGQKQRLALARALVLKRPFIIMDDCLSAVDSETEKRILENLKEKWHGTTSIVVSHRLSAFFTADNIIVLDNGKVESQGNHQTLKEKSVIYKSMFEKQQIEKELENEL
ncbi:MAG: ABC transporter ATP-binding protein/permease [Candidatus Muirbacterium halophilum]|nr:ABC transporter ATP-binding protein/permease [Candidatus Muirbacterium halophilum]MCK9475102.1 ABC transporter ATP-binding protein/permease [Candidatus Muirbacterium halophilum]